MSDETTAFRKGRMRETDSSPGRSQHRRQTLASAGRHAQEQLGPRRHRQAHEALALRYAGFTAPYVAASVLTAALVLILALSLAACTEVSNGSDNASSQTSGPAFERTELILSPFDEQAALEENGAFIDTSHLAEGYVAAAATSTNRLKFQVASDGVEYNYDLPNDGTPISCPLSMDDGSYSFTVWENTAGNRYVELASTTELATLADEFQPFLRPSTYCDYNEDSKVVQLANDLCADAQNQGDAVQAIYDWIVSNIAYDEQKAIALADATGYIPSPDTTVEEGSGICFDYASLAAAMLRSQGIACKINTGTVSPDNIYHAWNMVYIDGTWMRAGIDIKQNAWTRIDTTFAAGSGSDYAGDGTNYTDRYTY